MNKFKIGDEVLINEPNSFLHNREGVITDIEYSNYGRYCFYYVDVSPTCSTACKADQLSQLKNAIVKEIIKDLNN